ncbi:hypothetical protein F2Q70_00018632 [Brassica cretica]|uniref:Small ribosomal subunit protein mS41 SAM domain-containing protein n=1 Tax=Brassica cretica TaxID=69181 RepID=A0A8S9HTU1_BRACR|nr:hypothetical protein F2Q70_00018632 [Brassica cretica]
MFPMFREFLSGIGGRVETHIPELETAIGDLLKLLVARTLRLKKFGIPCKHVSLITSLFYCMVYTDYDRILCIVVVEK